AVKREGPFSRKATRHSFQVPGSWPELSSAERIYLLCRRTLLLPCSPSSHGEHPRSLPSRSAAAKHSSEHEGKCRTVSENREAERYAPSVRHRSRWARQPAAGLDATQLRFLPHTGSLFLNPWRIPIFVSLDGASQRLLLLPRR